VDITAPATCTLVTSGSATERIDNRDATATWRFASGPVRDFMVVLSDRLELVSTAVGHVTVNSYYLPEDKSSAEAVLEQARNALRAYQQAFGVYPYAELDAVEAPVPGGMEYPGLVLLGSDAYGQSSEYLEFLVAHEVAHQWWYGLVGNDQVSAPWLDESLANFSILYYYEHSYGQERAELAFKTYVADSYTRALELGRDAAVNQPVSAFAPQDYGPIVYGKGALFFYHVREQLGSDVMMEALRSYVQRYRFRLVTADDLLAVLGGTSGENLSQLYDRWIL
jgi:aminopeptidase N